MKKQIDLSTVTKELAKSDDGQRLSEALKSETEIAIITPENLRPLILSLISQFSKEIILFLTFSPSRLSKILSDINSLSIKNNLLTFPDWEVIPGERLSPNIEIIGKRSIVLNHLKNF